MARPRSTDPSYSLAERNGRFYVQWWDGKAKRRVSLGTADREEAKRKLRQFMAGLDSPLPPESPTVRTILAGYVEDRRPRVRSIASIEYASAALNSHLGDLKPEHLTRQVCRKYADQRRSEGARTPSRKTKKPLSNGTIIREIVTLRAALRWAVSEKWISEAPQIEAPPAPPPRERWLTRDEAKRLLAEAKTPHVHLFILIGLYTGARTGAILDLKWDRVDFVSGIINFGTGESNKRRSIVPMVPQLKEALQEAVQIRCTDYVVEFNGKKIASVRHAFRDCTVAARLKNVTPHTLRHTCATWMVMNGVQFEMVAKFLGNSVDMIERVYGHHSPDWLQQAIDALSTVKD